MDYVPLNLGWASRMTWLTSDLGSLGSIPDTGFSFYLCSEFLATHPEARVRFPALPDFLRSCVSGTASNQPLEYNWGATLKKKVAAPVKKTEITAVGIRRADHATPLYPQKLALTLPTSGGRSVGIVRSRTKATKLFIIYLFIHTNSGIYRVSCLLGTVQSI
jgi:hypothetical protein